MSGMKLVIEISEEDYQNIKEDPFLNHSVYSAVKNGTPFLEEIKELKSRVIDYLVHSPYFHKSIDCCRCQDDVKFVFDKYLGEEKE